MGKKEELEELDTIVRQRLIELVKTGKTDLISELGTAVSYLARNQVGGEKEAGVDVVKRRLKEAEARRASNNV